MSSLKNIWATTCPYMLSVSLIRCNNEALKNLHLKSTIQCFKKKKRKYASDQKYHTHFSPIDCCVRINDLPDRLFIGDIQS